MVLILNKILIGLWGISLIGWLVYSVRTLKKAWGMEDYNKDLLIMTIFYLLMMFLKMLINKSYSIWY